MKKIFILGMIFSTLIIASCVKDLDVKPLDKTKILAGNLFDDPAYLQQALGKVYASFVLPGQGNSDDIASSDPNFTTTTRALWNLQEITTDEAICAWGDPGIADLNTQTWTPNNPFLTALYQRLSLSVTYANEFIRNTAGNTDPTVMRYNAEARFLRALAYTWAIDLFANPPFTTEADPVGKFFPSQADPDPVIGRQKMFAYIVAELKDIETKLGAPKSHYPQADQASAWMLLARLYVNAQVWTGTAQWENAKTYCDKVINSGKYSLAPNYRQNFSADNDGYNNPEMIFAWNMDGVYTQGYVATTFIIESSSDAVYIRAEDFHGLTSNTNWNGNRTKKEFMYVLLGDSATAYKNDPTRWETDQMFQNNPDKRILCKVKKSYDIPSASASGDYGIGVYKFTAKNADGSKAANYNSAFASTDFPVFRYADAILMRAEAKFRLGDAAGAAADINLIRERAFGSNKYNIDGARLTSTAGNFILDERGREFYYEAQRRTDLVRFGKFTDGNYNWSWKGGVYAGKNTDKKLNVFPIPGDEISSNPNIKQNQ